VYGSTDSSQEWQVKLSGKGVAQMPWDPKPVPPAPQQPSTPAPSLPSASTNGQTTSSYGYEVPTSGARVKAESAADPQYLSNGSNATPTQGGLARAQQLMQQYGNGHNPASAPSASTQRGGLALPGQQARPPGLQLPGGQNAQQMQQYSQQLQQQAYRQQQQLQQQQAEPRIKVESDSPQVDQGQFQRQPHQPPASYPQTDGADDGLAEWQAMLAQRRAVSAEQVQRADRLMHDEIMRMSSDLQSGLMVPLDAQPKRAGGATRQRKPPVKPIGSIAEEAGPSVPQLDGDVDDEDAKPEIIKDEEDEDAINSDLDDSDDDGQGPMGDDDDDMGDSILCTYDKTQRVKNKWKCTLKDGVMSVQGKEWVFHRGTGEFEW